MERPTIRIFCTIAETDSKQKRLLFVFVHFLQFATVFDANFRFGRSGTTTEAFDFRNDIHTFHDPTEDHVLAVKPSRWNGGNEKLGTVGVRSCVGHAQQSRHVMTKLKRLVLELLAIDAFSTGAVTASEVATLQHELRDDSVENALLEVQRLARAAFAFFAGAETTEVFHGFWHIVTKQTHHDSSGIFAIDSDVEINFGSDFTIFWGISSKSHSDQRE